jgi:dienelactone hydrolase
VTILLGDLPVYVVGSAENGRAVILTGDIYGFDVGRSREVSDHIAESGFIVINPDFFR